ALPARLLDPSDAFDRIVGGDPRAPPPRLDAGADGRPGHLRRPADRRARDRPRHGRRAGHETWHRPGDSPSLRARPQPGDAVLMRWLSVALEYVVFAALLPFLLIHPRVRQGFWRRLGFYGGRDALDGKAGPRVWLHGAS